MKMKDFMKALANGRYLDRLPKSLLYKYRRVPCLNHNDLVKEMIARAAKRGITLSKEDAGERMRKAVIR
jgi:hypothetical protein